MIIDLHTHPFGNPAFDPGAAIKSRRDVVNLRRQRPDLFSSRYINVQDLTDLLVEDMNAGGIGKAFIQPGFAEDPELVAKAVSKHPQHLVGLFNVGHEGAKHPAESNILQPIDWKRTAEQVDHYVKDLGLVGCGEVLPTRFSAESAPERVASDLRPLMEILEQHQKPVMFLTGWTQFSTPLYHGMPLFVDVLAEWFPDVPLIITKMGRGYSFIFEMSLAIAFKHANVYFDIVQAPADHIGTCRLGTRRRPHHVRYGLVADLARRGRRHLPKEPQEGGRIEHSSRRQRMDQIQDSEKAVQVRMMHTVRSFLGGG
jgi:predicted TIM-barrel fold metal-dependent hydrolase